MEEFEVEYCSWSYYFALFPKQLELKTFVVAVKINIFMEGYRMPSKDEHKSFTTIIITVGLLIT